MNDYDKMLCKYFPIFHFLFKTSKKYDDNIVQHCTKAETYLLLLLSGDTLIILLSVDNNTPRISSSKDNYFICLP